MAFSSFVVLDTFQVIQSHPWLVAVVPDGADRGSVTRGHAGRIWNDSHLGLAEALSRQLNLERDRLKGLATPLLLIFRLTEKQRIMAIYLMRQNKILS